MYVGATVEGTWISQMLEKELDLEQAIFDGEKHLDGKR